jgi:serine/threonine-protein kinase
MAAAPPRAPTAAPRGPVGAPPTGARAVARPATDPPIDNDTAPQGQAAAAVPNDPYIGATVADRYKVIRKLGEGGMGVVYLAEHVFIEKRVALKVLSDDFARKADLVARFMQEAKAASKIGHENIVDITDFGETHSGSVFFAMEFLDGMDLAGHIREGGAMPFERARAIVNQICRALGAAHTKGIIHRDMKPENIYLVTREGKPDFVKILDFGIAKMSSLDEGGSRLTRTGMIFGTPEYMSPEQAKGDRPDHRVDIYALGCILYEMLTGDVPFHAETFMGVLTKHMFEPPQPPSQRNPNVAIPHDVEAVVLKALAKDRDQRYQTMKEMAVALEACSGGDPLKAWGSEGSGVLPLARETSDAFRVQGGSHVGPAASAAAVPRTAAQPEVTPSKKRTGLYAGVIAALLLIAGTAVVMVSGKKPQLPPPVVKPAVAVAPVVAPPPPPAAKEPARPTSFTASISTNPSGAEIFSGAERLGVTPFNVVLPASDTPVELTLKKKGYKDALLKVVPNRDHDFVNDLVAAAHGHATSPRPARPEPAAVKPAAKPEPAKPAEAPAPKPAGKLRDLKDPFAN